MPFARRTTHHQGPHAQETRPNAADRLRRFRNPRTGASKKVLIQKEERLNGADIAAFTGQHEIAVVEALLAGYLPPARNSGGPSAGRKCAHPSRAALDLRDAV